MSEYRISYGSEQFNEIPAKVTVAIQALMMGGSVTSDIVIASQEVLLNYLTTSVGNSADSQGEE